MASILDTMKNPVLRPLALSALAGSLALGVSACSSSGDDSAGAGSMEEFCAMAEGQLVGLDGTDPDAIKQTVIKNNEELQAITPPAEIADAYAMYAPAYDLVAQSVAEMDPSDEQFIQGLAVATAPLSEPGVQEAIITIGTYTQENCDVPES